MHCSGLIPSCGSIALLFDIHGGGIKFRRRKRLTFDEVILAIRKVLNVTKLLNPKLSYNAYYFSYRFSPISSSSLGYLHVDGVGSGEYASGDVDDEDQSQAGFDLRKKVNLTYSLCDHGYVLKRSKCGFPQQTQNRQTDTDMRTYDAHIQSVSLWAKTNIAPSNKCTPCT